MDGNEGDAWQYKNVTINGDMTWTKEKKNVWPKVWSLYIFGTEESEGGEEIKFKNSLLITTPFLCNYLIRLLNKLHSPSIPIFFILH